MRILLEKKRHRAALRHASLALACLAGGVLSGACASNDVWRLALVALGLAGYVANGANAVRLLIGPMARRSSSLFPAPRAAQPPAAPRPTTSLVSKVRTRPWLRAVGILLVIGATAAPARAQQTIFNVPSADVLDKGKFYLETDALWRPQEPNFAVFTARGSTASCRTSKPA